MCGVDDNDVDPGLDQQFGPLEAVGAGADGGADDEASEWVLAGAGIFAHLFDILDGDQPFEDVVVIHHQQLFDTVPVKMLFGVLQGGSRRHRDQIFLGHDMMDRLFQIGLETQIPIGEDADQLAVFGDRHAGDAVFLHHVHGVADLLVGTHGDRIDDHAALRFLHLIHLERLLLRGHVLVDHPQPPLAGHADGRPRFGHRIHGGGNQRDAEFDFPGQPRGQVGLLGQNGGVGRHQEHIIKGQTFPDRDFRHGVLLWIGERVGNFFNRK